MKLDGGSVRIVEAIYNICEIRYGDEFIRRKMNVVGGVEGFSVI